MDLKRLEGVVVPAGSLDSLGSPPEQGRVAFDRVEGMLLGLAIGDALGNTSESRFPGTRRDAEDREAEIRDYQPNRYADGARVGVPSDDTQLAFWTLESLIEHGHVVPEDLAARFARRRIFGIGQTVRAFLSAYHAGLPWQQAAQRLAGNGALMRIAPVVIPHLGRPSMDLWVDAILAGAVTHNDPSSIAACVALTGILWEVLAMDGLPQPTWWLDTYCSRAACIEGEMRLTPRRPGLDFHGPIWRFVDTEVRQTLARDLPVLAACDRWYSGAFLLETVPSVLYILGRHADDPEEAIVRAVNDTYDNDTVGAIVGAVVGALHGRSRLPERWVSCLLGRTTEADDGRVFELVRQARTRFCSTAMGV